MGNYQPNQGLTWRYSAADGKLSIVVKIYVSVGANEHIAVSISSIRSNTISVLLSLNGTENSPITRTAEIAVLNPNLSYAQVRSALASMQPFSVITTFYGNATVEGEVINMTTQNSEIEIL